MKNFLNGKVKESQNDQKIFRDGNLIYSKLNQDSQEPVLVGEIDNLKEISAKNDLIILLSDRITIMTCEFDIITEIDVQSLSRKSTQVALGWGSKKTQFHGSEGKQAAAVEVLSSGLVEGDNLEPSISWRGDGEYFVVNWVFDQNRMLLIFDREGTLQSTSEPVPFLEGVLSWRPSGNLIASTQKLSHKHDVVFFERNGLRHGEFSLPDKDCQVHQLEWNIDSTTLAILITSGGKKSLQFWSSNNYHWYLVYEIKKDISSISWDQKSPLLIHTKDAAGKTLGYSFSLTVHKSNSLDDSNPATVAVIDGKILKYTPFKIVNVPPPMSHSESHHSSSILNLSFSPTSIGDSVAVLLSNQTIDFVDKISLPNPTKREFSLDLSLKFNYVRQILWIAESKLLVLDWDSVSKKDVLTVVEFNLYDPDGNPVEDLYTKVQIPGLSSIVQLYYNPNLNIIACENADGDIFEIYENGQEWNAVLKTSFGVLCTKIACCIIGENEKVWIGLTPRNKLYLNNDIIASDCTSFEIHREFLIITTYGHVAKFLSLKLPLDSIFLF
jgi:elongator complex protein 1